jgi:NTP pyrophosphatase (non-canonical NTP hydrolase)
MKNEFLQVRDFHTKHGFLTNKKVSDCEGALKTQALISELLTKLCEGIKEESINLQELKRDPRLYRMYLILEEVEELNAAMYVRDEVQMLDALEDLLYVVIGTAVTFNFPLEEGWQEVHRSNMTKKVRDPQVDPRMRNKGPDFVKADFKKIIERWRANAKSRAEHVYRSSKLPNRFRDVQGRREGKSTGTEQDLGSDCGDGQGT